MKSERNGILDCRRGFETVGNSRVTARYTWKLIALMLVLSFMLSLLPVSYTHLGQHGVGGGRKRVKEYGLQLREKQKAKRYYGILEKQFKNYFVKADKKEGQTGENLLTMIERRLDNVVYRMGMAESRREARQLVRHGHFRVNGRKVDIPSYLVKKGDIITLREQRCV